MQSQIGLGNNAIVVAKKSWLAYVKALAPWFLVLLFLTAISPWLGLVYLFSGVYIFLYLKSITLFIDDAGVWVYQGVFPWSKGFYGIRWQDFGQALFYQNPISYFAKLYHIQIKNRYKEEAEIDLTDIANGDIAVTKINQISVDF